MHRDPSRALVTPGTNAPDQRVVHRGVKEGEDARCAHRIQPVLDDEVDAGARPAK
jgi:hypothetical protein